MTEIILYELKPTRSARCRWTLLEARLKYESRGNTIEVFSSQELKQTHPLGKLPAAVINGKPLFESAAICTAIADLVPEQNLIAKSGTWARALHDQWTLFVLTEIEPYLWSSELNTDKNGFLLPNEEQVPAIADQNRKFAQRAAVALDAHLQNQEYLVENRFTVTDIITGYTVGWLEEVGLLESFPSLTAYLNRLSSRQHCTLTRHN